MHRQPHSTSRGPFLHNSASDTESSFGCPLLFHLATLLPTPLQVHKPLKPRHLRHPPPSLPSFTTIRVVSFNTAKGQNTRASILHFLNEGYDVILLQEGNPPPSFQPTRLLLSQPPLPPCIFRKPSKDEKQQFTKSIQRISDWCQDLQDVPAGAPLDEIITATDPLLMQVRLVPEPQRKDQEGYVKLRKLLRSPPPLSSQAFPERIAEVQSVVNTLRSSDETKAKRKLHSSLVRGVQMKSTVARTLCPKDLEPVVLKDPKTQELLSDRADVAKVFGDTLLHLCGHPDYTPPQDFVDQVLSHSPTCPVSAKNDHIPSVSWQEFQSHLKHSKPSKAERPDKTNNYILALCPEPIQCCLHSILNRFLHSPLPPHWLMQKCVYFIRRATPSPPKITVRLPS